MFERMVTESFYLPVLCNVFGLELLINHSVDAGIGPDIDARFDHIDNRVDRQDDSQNSNRSADTGHQGESQEETAHRHPGVTDRGNHRDQDPQQNCTGSQFHAAILHHKERGHKDKRRTAVHVDGAAQGQHKTGNFLLGFLVVFLTGASS